MIDNEGSLSSEDADIDDAEETQDDAVDSTESTEADASTTDDKAEAASTDSSLKDQEQKDKAELSEKGTKLDPDPLSRVNQELANERRKIKEYEEVLNNPALLKSYVAKFGEPEAKKEETVSKEKEMRYEDVQTNEDLHKFLKQQDEKVQAKLKELDSSISEVKSSHKNTTVASRIQSDITTVRETYPELNPKSSDYNKELDDAVGQLYEKYDYDPQSKTFKGDASIKDIADIIMKAAGSSKKQGSEEAQTTIRDKRSGRAVSGASKAAPDESNMTPGQIIASRIKAARGGR
jgi:hypothetical protein